MNNDIPATVPERMAARAAARPDDIAHEVARGARLTLGEWHERSNAAARGLIERGVGPGDRVVLWCASQHLIEYAIAYAAVHKAGATAVPVPQSTGEHQLDQVCEQVSAAAVITEEPFASGRTGATGLAALERRQRSDPLELRVQPHHDAEILFTSGTTGRPKGVVASHANILSTHSALSPGADTHVVLHALPAASLAGQGLLLQPLDGVPHRVITVPGYDDSGFAETIHRYRPTHIVLVPAIALSLINSRAMADLDTSSVKVVRTISAPIAPAALARLDALFPSASIFNMYTSTEAFPARVKIKFDPLRPSSVGRADRAGAIRVVADDATALPPNNPGKVELKAARAPQRRYLDDDAATAAVFRSDGWVRTGDLGKLDADGYLYLLDRHQDLVISGGLNISTIEVEAVIQDFDGVRDAAAFGLPHPALGEYVAAAVVPGPGFDRGGLNDFLYARLGPAKAPKRVLLLDALPRNELGKVLKRQLRDSAQQAEGASPAEGTERGEFHERVRRIWAEEIGEPITDWSADFLALGGTSLTAMAIVARIREELGRQVSQRDIFETVTLDDFASRVEQAPPSSASRRKIQRVDRSREPARRIS
jgi:acyl-CoA synthetase (AMP-forming)/AMP-acid ligase II/acyl carrier protein